MDVVHRELYRRACYKDSMIMLAWMDMLLLLLLLGEEDCAWFGAMKGKRIRSRPKIKWEEVVEKDMKDLELQNWRELINKGKANTRSKAWRRTVYVWAQVGRCAVSSICRRY